MSSPASSAQEVRSFVAEARAALPVVRELIAIGEQEGDPQEAVEQAYRHVHSLRGAASMFRQRALSRLAGRLETTLGEVREGRRPLDRSTVATLGRGLDDIQLALAGFATLAGRIDRRSQEVPDDGEEIREIFRLEAEDHLSDLNRLFDELERRPQAGEALDEVRRRAHSLKGGAATAGFAAISTLAHRMEDYLEALLEGRLTLDAEGRSLLHRTTDAIQGLLQDSAEPLVDDLMEPYSELLHASTQRAPPGPTAAGETAVRGQPAGSAGATSVRVPLEQHDHLLRLIGELTINRSALDLHAARLSDQIGESDAITTRLSHIASWLEEESEEAWPLASGTVPAPPEPQASLGASPHGFDELELERYSQADQMSRALLETTADLQTVGGELRAILQTLRSALGHETSLHRELEDLLVESRTVRFGVLVPRLQRAARITAGQQQKPVELRVQGQHVEVDKAVLEELAAPLLQLIRNAVDHGIETRDERRAAGKPEQGLLDVAVEHRGRTFEVHIRDDGRGLDSGAIAVAAERLGLADAATLDGLSLGQIHELVFRPNLTTADRLSEISGRGVGLDLVKTTIDRLQGRIGVASEPGRGTHFTLRLPTTLATDRVLLVRASGRTYALPQSSVEQVHNLPWATLAGRREVEIDGRRYRFRTLSAILGYGPTTPPGETATVLVLAEHEGSVAVAVDTLVGSREVVVKSLGTHLRRVPGVSGATILGDGSLVPILGPGELAEEALPTLQTRRPAAATSAGVVEVLVVDDSLSVRRSLERSVRNAGWRPLIARDGQEALEILQRAAGPPDVIVLDVEMPRMDGYELAATLQGLETLRDVPIVMLTSRAGERHRRHAIELGVREYLVKPYQEEQLLETVRRLARRA